jgi:UDP-N-acetylmuramate dehydrogenase
VTPPVGSATNNAAAGLAAALGGVLAGRAELDAPLAPFTTYRLGGPAAVLVTAEAAGDLDLVAAHWDCVALPLLIVGRGSNLLVSDAGFAGLVLHLGAAFSWGRLAPGGVRAGGGTPLPWLARWAARQGLAGLSYGVAVPGSVGGAVRMNAGAHGTETREVLEDADVVDLASGRRRRVPTQGLGLGYRRSGLAPSEVVEAAAFRLAPGDPSELEREMRDIVRWRKEHQPGGQPSAGSVFANPPGDSAGRLIEAAGAKAWRVGGAEVSARHANFFVTHPGATATDVAELMVRVRHEVQARFGVTLHPEVRLVGKYPEHIMRALAEETG